jgi:hypothetical protein
VLLQSEWVYMRKMTKDFGTVGWVVPNLVQIQLQDIAQLTA